MAGLKETGSEDAHRTLPLGRRGGRCKRRRQKSGEADAEQERGEPSRRQ